MRPFERISTRLFVDLVRIQSDVAVATSEMWCGLATVPALANMAPKGDGTRHVLTIPGFTGPEFSLAPLNSFLTSAGFPAQSWGLGINTGRHGPDFYSRLSKVLGRRLRQIADESGNPVSLIGQSLGGLYAREVARDHPDLVDRVITLGSPVYLKSYRLREMNHLVATIFQLFKDANHNTEVRRKMRQHRIAPPVPVVSIFSKFDGVLSWQSTKIPDEDIKLSGNNPRENIEITASHCGMGVNPLVLLAVADRLAQDTKDWQPFTPAPYFPQLNPAITAYWYPPQPGLDAPASQRVPYLRIVKG